jgi:hypothetical protein
MRRKELLPEAPQRAVTFGLSCLAPRVEISPKAPHVRISLVNGKLGISARYLEQRELGAVYGCTVTTPISAKKQVKGHRLLRIAKHRASRVLMDSPSASMWAWAKRLLALGAANKSGFHPDGRESVRVFEKLRISLTRFVALTASPR